jgi:excisionase family DNA binding protein
MLTRRSPPQRSVDRLPPQITHGAAITSTGNQGLDALADAIAERVYRRLTADLQRDNSRLLDVAAAAVYLGRSESAVRHLIGKKAIPCVRRDGRVQLDRQDLDDWLELGKTGV